MVKPVKVEKHPTNISNCNFVGVQFDAKSVNAIEMIAQGLVENAKALGALATVLKASNVEVQALLRIEN
tara:strand:+ start:478 stop:684 length:207 start_codon:yes stop_codon:yes gene_type:complete